MCALAPCASAGKSFYCDQSRSRGGVNSEQRLLERKNRTPRTAQLNPPTVTLIWELPKPPHKTPLYMQLQPPCASPAIAKKGVRLIRYEPFFKNVNGQDGFFFNAIPASHVRHYG
ncbi:hypothetical protein Bbelb_234630 [Branchiostoma belcheri]|nr:hypothetical protein Bbelb_234630 [Branchiostoma belcheri]